MYTHPFNTAAVCMASYQREPNNDYPRNLTYRNGMLSLKTLGRQHRHLLVEDQFDGLVRSWQLEDTTGTEKISPPWLEGQMFFRKIKEEDSR